jgi:phosphopantothenoylcysteine decarboxylase/phosphopantothenate--cysteine ligase
MSPKIHTLITAGPTREPIDPVRFISNRSSGKMGYALAAAALKMGHQVTLISGPTSIPVPAGVRTINVETAREMYQCVLKYAPLAHLIIMVAAVSDYEMVKVQSQKLKKKAFLTLQLRKTPDILEALGRKKRKAQILVGFAAETRQLIPHARKKLRSKKLDFIVANSVGGKNQGFESDENAVTILDARGRNHHLPKAKKTILAERLLRMILRLSSKA